MNDIVSQMIGGYLGAFDTMPITDTALQKEVDAYKKKLTDFAQSNSDPTTFYDNFTKSGLQEEYSALITKVSMSGMATAPAETPPTDKPPAKSGGHISVKDFVAQYKVPYEEVKKAGFRKRAEAAYEQIFAVADKTDDMLEAQMILEKERLLWKIVAEDALDIFEPILEVMDPLWQATTANLKKQVEVYQKATSDEELSYLLEKAEFETLSMMAKGTMDMALAAAVALHLINFSTAKTTIYEWKNETAVQDSVMAMIATRKALKRLSEFMKKHLNLTFDDLFHKEELKIWLLSPNAVDDFARVKSVLHTQNLDVFKDMLDNEIFGNLSIYDILMRQPAKVFWYDVDGDEISNQAHQKAAALDANFTYYKYQDQLAKQSATTLETVKKQQDLVKQD